MRRGIRQFLFNVLHHSQEGRMEKTNIKPKTIECIYSSPNIPHIDFTQGHQGSEARGLASVS